MKKPTLGETQEEEFDKAFKEKIFIVFLGEPHIQRLVMLIF